MSFWKHSDCLRDNGFRPHIVSPLPDRQCTSQIHYVCLYGATMKSSMTMCFSFIFPHGVDDLIRVMLASPTKRLMIISKSSSDVILPRVSKHFTLAPRLAPTVANAYRCLPLAVIARHRLSLLTAACHWLSLLVIACHCVPLLAIGCHCLSLPAFDCRCLPLVVIACHRVPLLTAACR